MVFCFSNDKERAYTAIPAKCGGDISAWKELANNRGSLIHCHSGNPARRRIITKAAERPGVRERELKNPTGNKTVGHGRLGTRETEELRAEETMPFFGSFFINEKDGERLPLTQVSRCFGHL